jgi:hypothetical protein
MTGLMHLALGALFLQGMYFQRGGKWFVHFEKFTTIRLTMKTPNYSTHGAMTMYTKLLPLNIIVLMITVVEHQ